MSTKSLSQILAALIAAFWIAAGGQSTAQAAGDTRTLSLYFTHTKESLTVTYKKDGRYVPSAMKQLNHFLRDWRKKEATRMDPKTIDLMWELHADLGSQQPIHIISGYRSPKTNAMLRRIGRKVASRSRHMTGQAIDLYFPDIPIAKLRGSALVRKVGGVGYYPRSGKYGFVHIDSGNVRHWPRVSETRMAKIFREYRGTVGARLRRNGQQPVMVASAPEAPSGPVAITPKGFASAASMVTVPAPRPRPMEVVMAAAALADDLRIEPASAPVPHKNFATKPSIIRDDAMTATATLSDLIKKTLSPKSGPETNVSAKSGLAADIRNGTVTTTPLIRPLLTASQDDADGTSWWDSLFASGDSAMRRDGAPQPFTDQATTVASLSKSDEAALQRMIASLTGQRIISTVSEPDRSTKGDRLEVNRAGKGDLVAPAALPVLRRQSSLSGMTTISRKVARNDAAILQQGARPLSFE